MTRTRSLARSLLCLLAVLPVVACVGTELTVPSNHPGHPRARSAKLPQTTGLASDFEANQKQPAASEPAHTHGEASAVYTCPMHPEIERSEPATCPKCGMKLVPKQAQP